MVDISFLLRAKSRAIGTPLEGAAKRLRYLLNTPYRHKHPELWELYLDEKWLPKVLSRLLKRDTSCIDVGCHLGSFLSLVTRVSPEGIHLAFEPVAHKFSMLAGKFPRAKILCCALADYDGEADFYEDVARPGYSHLARPEDKASYKVKVQTLDASLVDFSPALIKIDVEGNELSVLKGAQVTIAKFRPAIIFECGSEYGAKADGRKQLFDFIVDSLGYNILTFTDFLFSKGPMQFDEFRRCGLYPFRAFNFLALPR